jgi:hypothetical protein
MLCGRDRPAKVVSTDSPQLAESSDDEASRRKIPPESAIATSVSNRKPRLAGPRDGSVVRAQLVEPCERDCGSHDGISVLIPRRGAAEMLVPRQTIGPWLLRNFHLAGGGGIRSWQASFDSRDGL